MKLRTTKYELQISDEFKEKLSFVSRKAGLTQPEAIAAGIDLLERLIDADTQGKEIAFVEKQKCETIQKPQFPPPRRIKEDFI